MGKHYFSFGQNHAHRVNNVTWDADCICCIEADNASEARDKMFEAFGDKWAFQYTHETFRLKFYPRGIINLES